MAEPVTANHVLSCDEVRRIDRYAIDKVGISGVVLMENAGRQVADAVERYFNGGPGRQAPLVGKAVAVVAGAGNNGGDGFVAARHLAIRGAKVATFLIYPEVRLSGDALTNWRILRNLGHDVRVLDAASLTTLATNLQPFDVVMIAGLNWAKTFDAETRKRSAEIAAQDRLQSDRQPVRKFGSNPIKWTNNRSKKSCIPVFLLILRDL